MLVNLVSVAVTACFFVATCHGASVPEAAETRSERFLGSLNRYYLTSWVNAISGMDMEQVPNDATAIDALTLTGTENVAIVVHGRESGAYSDFGITLIHSLVQADKYMAVILVDWAVVASLNYDQAVALVPFVAEDLITFITRMVTSGKLNRNSLHLIGFDLGAHIVGIASRHANVRARKITGLSPAGDGWDIYSQRLRATDAQFVETINTNAIGRRAFGVAELIGGLDFFPNGGARQPGCATSDNWCHHNRAWQLFAATVDMGGHLLGQRCDSMTQVNNNRCTGPVAVMGSLVLEKLPWAGLYRVNTGRTYPYSI